MKSKKQKEIKAWAVVSDIGENILDTAVESYGNKKRNQRALAIFRYKIRAEKWKKTWHNYGNLKVLPITLKL